jgi:sulfur carrier protein
MPSKMTENSPSIEIQLNGEPYRLEGDAHLTALIEKLNMKRGRVAVELNGEVVPRAEHANVVLRAGDRLEIINFVGGG